MNRNAVLGAVFAVLLAIVGLLLYLNFVAPPPRTGGTAVAARTAGTPAPAHGAPAAGAPARATAPAAAPARAEGPGARPTAPLPEAAVPGQKTKLLLYYQGQDVGLLFPEEREAEDVSDASGRARLVLDELAKGPKKDLLPTIPAGARVRQVYFDASGTAFVDFTHELRDNHPGGSDEELMTVDSIVNTLARNVPQVRAVQLLIEGRPVPTLAGHVDLQGPLRPMGERLAQAK